MAPQLNAAAATLLLILLGWIFARDLSQSADMGLYDKSNYLNDAFQNLFPKNEAVVAPSYALWFRASVFHIFRSGQKCILTI